MIRSLVVVIAAKRPANHPTTPNPREPRHDDRH